MMSLFELLVAVTGLIFLIVAHDLFQRRKFNFLHFLVFFGGSGMIVLFVIEPTLLERFGQFFGIARGADLLVYMSIIFLVYLYFESLNQLTKTNYEMTRLCQSDALERFRSSGQFTRLIELGKHDDQQIGFLIRAYNEGRVIDQVIDEIIEAGWTKIVIVDDGSTDETVLRVQQLQEEHPEICLIVISHLINRGGGAANKTLFAFAGRRGELLGVERWVTYDADGQMQIDDMAKFVAAAEHGQYDILLGSRFVEGGEASNMPQLRKLILWGSKFVTYLFNKLRVTDPHNGYRMIRQEVIGQIRIDSDGMTYASELLDEIQRLELRYGEVPVSIRYTDYSLAKGQKNMNALNILSELIYKRFFYK